MSVKISTNWFNDVALKKLRHAKKLQYVTGFH